MKRGGFAPAPEFEKERGVGRSNAPRWSDFPEHKGRGRKSEYQGPPREKREYKQEDSRAARKPARASFGGRFKPAPEHERQAITAQKTRDFAPAPPERFSPESFVSPQAEEGIIAGINSVLELLRSDSRPVDTLFIDKDKGGSQFEQLLAIARKKGVQTRVVPRAALDKMAFGVRHQGVVATVPPKEYADPYKLAESAVKKGKYPLLVVLDGVEDPQNLGAIIRTAEGAGADGVVIPEHRAAHLTSAVSRASAGALEHMPVAKVPNLANYLNFLKENGFWIVGLAGDATEVYNRPDLTVPLALVLGGEGAGIRPVIRNSCDMLVSLPMLGKVSALNVSVAAGVMLYEVLRQRAISTVG